MRLTPEQIQLFHSNGYLILPERLPEARLSALRDAVGQDISNSVEPVVRNRDGKAVRLSDVYQRGGVFRETLTSPLVLDPLESLLGPNIELILNRHNHATLRTARDGAAYAHRDVLQWTRTIVTVIFYLEEATVEKGCTRIVPGSHVLSAATDMRLEEDETMRASGVLEQMVPVPMPVGGMLAINSMVIHGPGINQTDETRMSMTAGYHAVDELCDLENPKRVLVRGERIYRGNDY